MSLVGGMREKGGGEGVGGENGREEGKEDRKLLV